MNDKAQAKVQLGPLTLKLGYNEIVIEKRCQRASKLNDVLIGLRFVVRGAFFYFAALRLPAIALFLARSVRLLSRPLIRILRAVHLETTQQTSRDY